MSDTACAPDGAKSPDAKSPAEGAQDGPSAGLVELLSALIGFESVSARSNLPIVTFIADYLRTRGVESRLIPNAAGDKASLLATIGPADRPGLALSAHTDVVPVEGQDWSSPPFAATIRDGRLYGRGSTDMKGFLAVVLAAVPDFVAQASARPVHLCFSYDEEVGCAGAPDLVAATAALPVPPALCIVGEPTSLKVAHAHKGKFANRLVVTGRGGHSALPHRAANAVAAAARIACGLEAIGASLAQTLDDAFDPPFTTVHVGSLHGGGALNLVPDRAVLEYEVRTVPGADAGVIRAQIDALVARVDAELKAQAPEAGIAVEPISAYPGLDTPADLPAAARLARLAGSNEAPVTLAFGTEAGLYFEAGIPTLVCGPGDIARAHKADEWVGLDELARAERLMRALARALGDNPSEPLF
ncbi:acetylornithine deacetylase [Ancylobacter sp. MQZ15Z-1]|uniref:Acetylornithine deacetylase n=1 Tax=Ancylobacter mangrovi TaxID=2972472 RepID=A0A9X2P948_9HYPH|nr:acetylornithine deacetylase [Ancylobacter mangrovi]MCS0494321.1 acetylornithine deacetylase [Ancylobacter mangrovi]